jgi:hypothetical protein
MRTSELFHLICPNRFKYRLVPLDSILLFRSTKVQRLTILLPWYLIPYQLYSFATPACLISANYLVVTHRPITSAMLP